MSHGQRAPEVVAGLHQVLGGPGKAQVEQALPLGAAVAGLLGERQGLLVVSAGQVELAQDFVRLAPGAAQSGRGRLAQLLGGLEGAGIQVEGLV